MANKEKKKIDFKHNLSEYWKILKTYKWRFMILLLIIVVLQVVEAIPKFLFKIIIDKGTEFSAGNVAIEALTLTLLIIGGVFFLTSIIQASGSWFRNHLVGVLDSDMIRDLKRKYFDHIVGLDHKFHTTHKTGSLISRMGRGAGAIEGITDSIAFNFVPLFVQLIVVGGSLAYFSRSSALVILGVTISFISYSYFIQRKQQNTRVDFNKAEDTEKGSVSDIFMNIDSIKYFGKENLIRTRFKSLANTTREKALKFWGWFRWFDAGQIAILAVGTFFLLYFPLMEFLAGDITLGTIVFIYTIYGNVVGPMFAFVWGMRGFYRAMADIQDLFEYGKVSNEIKDIPGAKKLMIRKGDIEFKNVGFSYGNKKLFDKFNLKIPQKRKVAFVGHSGCGKTSLVKLLYRFYDIDSGEILIDNKNINGVTQESLRGGMSIVPQECILFDDTIYNNVKFSNPRATREQVLSAMKFAQLDKIVKNMPDKENTIVGERGVKLSGGEKQRVSIARAILANKKILVLDEATSALDSETEHEIQNSLEGLMEGRTSIIIAHRLSTIMKADKIIVMDKGKIVQVGTHRQLINQQGQYKKLWNLQKGGYIK
jgi:ATP-binding cassette, subfamily B, heavy metal transporter